MHMEPLGVADSVRTGTEVELCEVKVQVLAADVVVRPVDAPLQLAKEVSALLVDIPSHMYSPAW